MVAHSAIRNKGTHGGSIAYGDPAAELPAFAVAANAEIILMGLNGIRTIQASNFYHGLFETDIQDDEIETIHKENTAGPVVETETDNEDKSIPVEDVNTENLKQE